MGGFGAPAPDPVASGASGEMIIADDNERAAAYSPQRSTLADAAEGLSSEDDGAGVFLRLARHRRVDYDQSPAGDGVTRGGGARGLTSRRGHRQPERKTTESGGPTGYDAGKKIKGRKRHILTDTGGLVVAVRVHTADIQDRDGAPNVLTSIRSGFPWLRHVLLTAALPATNCATPWPDGASGR